MHLRLTNWLGVVFCLVILIAGGCGSSIYGISLSPTPGPQLSVTVPDTIVGGQPSFWEFSWSMGQGGPYRLSVELSNELAGTVTWQKSDINGGGIGHEFVLPNTGSSAVTYRVRVSLSDKLGPSDNAGFIPAYDGSDEVVLNVTVLPEP